MDHDAASEQARKRLPRSQLARVESASCAQAAIEATSLPTSSLGERSLVPSKRHAHDVAQ